MKLNTFALLLEVKILAGSSLSQSFALSLVKIHNIISFREYFTFQVDRLVRLLFEEAINLTPFEPKVITTATGEAYHGLSFCKKVNTLTISHFGSLLAFLCEINLSFYFIPFLSVDVFSYVLLLL